MEHKYKLQNINKYKQETVPTDCYAKSVIVSWCIYVWVSFIYNSEFMVVSKSAQDVPDSSS